MSIDEAITKAREKADKARESEASFLRYDLIWNAKESHKLLEEQEQLAEWLEELKAYREIGTVEECRNSVLDIERAYNKGYADGSLSVTEEIRGKAIDDFVNACKEDILCQTFGLHKNGVEKIAEQLKAGGEYGNK